MTTTDILAGMRGFDGCLVWSIDRLVVGDVDGNGGWAWERD